MAPSETTGPERRSRHGDSLYTFIKGSFAKAKQLHPIKRTKEKLAPAIAGADKGLTERIKEATVKTTLREVQVTEGGVIGVVDNGMKVMIQTGRDGGAISLSDS